jgi:hypothetical protein
LRIAGLGKKSKKLMKIGSLLFADFLYENEWQNMWRMAGFAEDFAFSPLCKSLWNPCGKVADKSWNGC